MLKDPPPGLSMKQLPPSATTFKPTDTPTLSKRDPHYHHLDCRHPALYQYCAAFPRVYYCNGSIDPNYQQHDANSWFSCSCFSLQSCLARGGCFYGKGVADAAANARVEAVDGQCSTEMTDAD